MKSQKTKFASLLAAVLIMIGSTNLQAQNDGPPNRQGNDRNDRMEMQRRGPQEEQGTRGPRIPNLSEEQESQLKAIHLKSEKAALPLKNQVGEKEARLQTLTTSMDFDAKAVNNIIDEIDTLKSDLMKLKITSNQEVKAILTEEQLIFFNKKTGEKRGPQQGRKR